MRKERQVCMKIKKRIKKAVFIFCAAFVLVGCKNGRIQMASTQILFTGRLSENEAFQIEDKVCTISQAKLFLANTKNKYEQAFGAELWEQKIQGETFEEYVRNAVKNQLAQIKAMTLLAEHRQISLNDEEKENATKAAEAYFSSLSTEEVEFLGITQEQIQELYGEYCLANKLYQALTSVVEEEISDSEAKVIVVRHIFFSTSDKSEEAKKVLKTRLMEIRNQAKDEDSFSSLAEAYSDDSVIEYSFGRGEMEKEFEEASFALSTGEISNIVETSSGYHLIYCVNDYDVEKTTLNKVALVEKRKEAAFDKEYQEFVIRLNSEVNEKAWNKISFSELDSVKTEGFFSVYEEYFYN